MRLFCYVVLLALNGVCAYSQVDPRFAPFDCRKHADEVFTAGPVPFAIEADIDEDIIQFEDDLLAEELMAAEGWKEWTSVENYAFGMNRGTLTMITDLNALHPYFRDKVIALIRACKAKGIDLAVVETYRTRAKQGEYKSMGKGFTNSGAGRSKHQYGLAVDVVPVVKGRFAWNNTTLWRKVGMTGEKLGLRWGGRWRKPYDPGHFEWTGGLATASLHAGMFPMIPKSDLHYPCLEEDLRALREYWSQWETEQSSLTRK